MSVINKMLQDLEQRQPATASTRTHTMAPLPRPKRTGRNLGLALLLVGLVILGWLWQVQSSQAQEQTPGQLKVQGAATTDTERVARVNAQSANIVAALTIEPAAAKPQLNQPAKVQPELQLQQVAKPVTALEQSAIVQPAIEQPVMAQPAAAKPQATVEKRPLSAAAQQQNMLHRANASEAAGDTSGAIVIWQQIVAEQPTQASGYLSLARLWLKQQQIVSASQVLLQARQNGVVSAEVNMQLAQLAVRQGQWQQALEFLPDQFELASEPEYFGFKATVLQQLQQYESALSWYQRLALLQPEQGRWSLGAALVSEQLGQPQQAYQYYQQAWQYRQALSASSHDFIQQRLKATEP